MNKITSILLVLILASAISSCESQSGSQDAVYADFENVGINAYQKKVFALQFTSTGCTGCPAMDQAISAVQSANSGLMLPVAFHMDYGMVSDPMAIPSTSLFVKKYDITALPCLIMDFNKSGSGNILADRISVSDALSSAGAGNPADCGIAVSTEYEEVSRSLTIKSRISTNVERRYRYHVFLVEDEVDGSYDNVARKMLSSDIYGKNVSGSQPIPAGYCAERTDRVVLEQEWNKDNMRVVVVAMTTDDEGITWTAVNANECAVGAEVSYELIPSAYRKQMALWEFTGTWCAFCPEGYNNLKFVISRNEAYAESVHVMAFHSSSSGDDPMALSQTGEIMSSMKIGQNFPSYLLDMNLNGSLSSITEVSEHLSRELKENPAHCAVAVASSLEDGKAHVEVKIISERDQTYRLAVFVVEDGIVSPQTLPTGTNATYVHDHVVRKIVSSSFRGDRVGRLSYGEEMSKSYTIELSDVWNIENTYLYALAINEDGIVNNMNICSINGGNSSYILK